MLPPRNAKEMKLIFVLFLCFLISFSKLLNRIRRGSVPCSKINKRVKNIHEALENQAFVIEGAKHIGIEVQSIRAEDLWSGKVWKISQSRLVVY